MNKKEEIKRVIDWVENRMDEVDNYFDSGLDIVPVLQLYFKIEDNISSEYDTKNNIETLRTILNDVVEKDGEHGN